MKQKIYTIALIVFAVTSITCESNKDTTKRRKHNQKPNQQQQVNQNAQPMTYEQKKEEDHRQMCNILGFASNIFNNFVHLVQAPNNRENVGQQVGNMAQNVYQIVAEATKSEQCYKSGAKPSTNVLDYLQSEQFKKDLTEIIVSQLEQIKN